MKEFVTSTTLLNQAYAVAFPIGSMVKSKPTNQFHKFIERFLPRSEEGVTSLLVFRKARRKSYNYRHDIFLGKRKPFS